MSKSHARASARRSARVSGRRPPPPDGAVYIGLAMIGVFGIGLWHLVSQETSKHGLLGYFIAIVFLINLYAWRACSGKSLLSWQQSLARLPLRFGGFGTKGGRPLEAAKGSDRAKIILLASVLASVVIIAAIWWVLPS